MVRELTLILGYYDHVSKHVDQPLLGEAFLSSVKAKLEAIFDAWMVTEEGKSSLKTSLTSSPQHRSPAELMASILLAFYEIPVDEGLGAALPELSRDPLFVLRLQTKLPRHFPAKSIVKLAECLQ